MLPDPPAALPPPLQSLSEPTRLETTMAPSSAPSLVRKILRSTRNTFGLFRQYHAARFPEHDPDENLTTDDLMDTSSGSPLNHPVDPYYAYPTRSSFLLGEWYWNDGVKKSQSSFRNLLKIVGNADFRPQDV